MAQIHMMALQNPDSVCDYSAMLQVTKLMPRGASVSRCASCVLPLHFPAVPTLVGALTHFATTVVRA